MLQRLRFSTYVIKQPYYKWVVITFIIWPFLRTHQPTNLLLQTFLSQTDPNPERRLWAGQVIWTAPSDETDRSKHFTWNQQPLLSAVSQPQQECWAACADSSRLFLADLVTCANLQCGLCKWRGCHTCLYQKCYLYSRRLCIIRVCACVCWQMKI